MSESKELTVPERAAVALGAAEHEKNLLVLATKYADITEIKNPAARDQVHSAYMELKNARTAIINAGKTAREDAVAFQRAVIAESDRLAQIVEPEQGRLQKLRDDFDAEREREKAAKAAAEKSRVDAIRKRIAETQSIPSMLVGKSSETIAAAIESLEAVEITLESFMEFSGEAELAKIAAVGKLGEMLSAQVAHEAEQKRLAEERAQLERERAEAAERDRVAALARAEEERKAREARQAEEDRLRAEREAAEAKLRAEREAHEAELRKHEAEFRRQQAEMAEKQRQLREATEKLAREQREREEAESARIAAAAKLEADHAEGLIENARIDAEREAAFEAQQRESQRLADEAERIRRERVQFELNGPDAREMIEVLAAHYQVEQETVLQWINRWIWAEVEVTA